MTGRWILLALTIGSLASVGMAQTPVKGNVWSNLDVQLYGFIKADAAYDDSKVTPGNYAAWVESENGSPSSSFGATRNDNEFNMTMKETRFGFKLKVPQVGKYAFSGQMEWDLFGENGRDNESKAELQTRHAFITVKDVDTGWSLLAGQTWDVVAPLNPRTLNYTVLWYAGNYGYRRPQIRLHKSYDLGNGQAFSVTGAVARTIGSANLPVNQDDTGADKGYPMFQGRVAWTFPLINGLDTTVGASGHFGEEEYDTTGSPTQDATVKTWSTCLDVTMPVCETLSFKGELYRGSNLSEMLGGIGHGVGYATVSSKAGPEEIHNYGGWVAAAINPANAWNYNVGYGFSKNDQSDLDSATFADTNAKTKASVMRLENSSVFANAICDINKHASYGIEVSRWLTKYSSASDADGKAWRAQLSLILKN